MVTKYNKWLLKKWCEPQLRPLDLWPWIHYPFLPVKSPNGAKKTIKGDRALILTYLDSQMAIFYFDHLQGANWGQSWTKNGDFEYIPCLCKSSSFSKYFRQHLCNYEDYLWLEFQLNVMLLIGVIAPSNPKMGPVVSWTEKTLCFF